MEGYLGDVEVDISDTPYKDFGPIDWALHYVELYGGIDGAHHKDWVMDQIARILSGTVPIVKLAKWDNGHSEYRITLSEPTEEYNSWVKDMKDGEDGPDTYGYSVGCAP